MQNKYFIQSSPQMQYSNILKYNINVIHKGLQIAHKSKTKYVFPHSFKTTSPQIFYHDQYVLF